MKTKSFILLAFASLLFFACAKEKNPQNYSFTGKAQKGPFVTGTTVTLNELNQGLGQTGKSFTTTIDFDDGSFNVSNVELTSNLILLTANGFYFSEVLGRLSSGTLSLQAIADIGGKELVNINVLTHLTKGRIENLVGGGMKFADAQQQATAEFLNFLNVNNPPGTSFENMSIAGSEYYNGILLAFSIILQRYTVFWNDFPALPAELTQLLSQLSADFASDGQINNQILVDQLISNISQLNLIDIRRNVETRYADLGIEVEIPNFERYIAKFQEKHSPNLVTEFTYPTVACPNPIMAPDSELPNILDPSVTSFSRNTPYTLAAITPLNSSLKIKFISANENSYSFGNLGFGWEFINSDYPNSFILNSQRQNVLMTMLFHLDAPGNAIIEYYENGNTTPSFVKSITWQ